MPDMREVFQMSTQKVRPDQGFTERQEFRQRRRMRNRKIGAYAMVAAIVAISVVAIAQVARNGPDTSVPGADVSTPTVIITHSYFDIATGERSPVVANLAGARVPEVSPDLRNVVYNTCCDHDEITVVALDGSTQESITPETLDGYGATWIDDQTILFQGRPSGTIEIGDLYVADISTGELTKVVDLPDMRNESWFVRSDLSPNGKTVLFHLPRDRGGTTTWDLWTAPLAGGDATLLRKNAGFAQYAPDGSIVFLDEPHNFVSSRISIMDGDGSNARSLVGPGGTYSWPQVSPDGTMVAYHESSANVEVVDIATGDVTILDASSEEPAWYGNDTLIVDD